MAQPQTHPKAGTISREELLKMIQNKEPVQIVNVLGPEYYNLGFIKGSLRIPLDELDSRLNELDRSKKVVTYCARPECSASRQAAEKLAEKGFNVQAYEGGIKEWKEANFPQE